ncbi:alpha/beta hydrolase [Actinocorallia populi]|uniref:alpha/beta hydrolase n=1 Tax=Actinocorallia populi TaxID=2079200 RepID=UPI000D092BA3|nr:alpha/beta hydrolase [Actinocorallia populi]
MGTRLWLALTGLAAAYTPAAHVVPPALSRPAPGHDPVSGFYAQKPLWTSCEVDPRFSCATLEAPLDYTRPGGETIRISLNMLPASDPSRRLGALVTNPGGPGSSGLEFVFGAHAYFSAVLRAHYDIIGMDPRGVGASTPVVCRSSDPRRTAEMEQAEDSSEYAALFARSCADASGALLSNVRTPSVARDLDLVRAALGQDRLHYYGASYGTLLGRFYAHLFPARTGRMALDSVVDPTGWPGDATAQAVGFETAFRVMVGHCARRPGCPLGADPPGALARVERLVSRADASPLEAGASGPVTGRDVLRVIQTATYREETWPQVTAALAAALRGDGGPLRTLAAWPSGSGREALSGGYQAVVCPHLRPEERTAEAAHAAGRAALRAAPLFGRRVEAQRQACARWPVASLPEAGLAVRTDGAPPPLLVHNRHDAATPVHWARSAHGQLPGSALVLNDSGGHGFYPMGECTRGIVDRFLTEGAMPAPGTFCEDRAPALSREERGGN